MRANRSRDTTLELEVRRELHRAGLRYRVDYPPETALRRRADIVFTRRRIAVFLDGCFWHGCPTHPRSSKTNTDYWRAKIEANQRRDAETSEALAASGWQVLRFWEHEDSGAIATTIIDAVRSG
jgi:DNA mismatch endonuclease (patch repair protein)